MPMAAALGAFWDRLDRLLGPNLGPYMEPTWAKKSIQKLIIFLDASWNRF